MPVLVGTWVLGTALATTLAWGAVRQVERRVTDRAPVLSEHRVEEAAQPRSRVADTVTTAPTIPAGDPGPGSTAPPGEPGGASSSGVSPGGGGTGTASPPPSTPPVTTAPPPPTGGVTSFVSVGGSASFRCSGGSAVLAGAQPQPGFTATTTTGNPYFVRFTSVTHISVIEAECGGTTIQGAVEEEPR